MKLGSLRKFLVLVVGVGVAEASFAAGASIVVEAAGSTLTLSGATAESFDGNFASVRLNADVQGKAGPRKGAVSAIGVPQSHPAEALAIIYGARMTEFRIEGLPEFMVKDLKEATAKKITEGIELEQESLMGPSYLPEPLYPKTARGLLRVWPRVEVRKTPAVLVQIDGDPIMATVPETELQYVVNTDWDLFFHQTAYNHFLRVGKEWYESYSVQGPWIPLRTELPKDFASIPEAHPRGHVRSMISKPVKDAKPLEVVVAIEPTELVVFAGEPDVVPIPNTAFSWAKNTESDVFFAKDGVVLLASGRWLAARSLNGPWQGLGDDVPPELAKIPKDHPRARARAHVPGTDEYKSAAAIADTAMTATVRRDLSLEVKLLGPPELVPVQGDLSYVKNTLEDMVAVGDKYYCCRNGVWFAAGNPTGPWAVCREVPDAVQRLPPSSPLYHLRFNQVVGYTPTTVTFGWTSGYEGVFVDSGALVYGTGFSDPGYVAGGVYYGLPPLLGLSRHFDAVEGRFVELPPLVSPFAGTQKDVKAATSNTVTGLWPRWGRVGYGLGNRELTLTRVRAQQWGEGFLAGGTWKVPLVDAAETAGKPSPPPAPDRPPVAQPMERLPGVYVATSGKVYRFKDGGWWELRSPGSNQWNTVKGVPREVELQSALTDQQAPRPRPKLPD